MSVLQNIVLRREKEPKAPFLFKGNKYEDFVFFSNLISIHKNVI